DGGGVVEREGGAAGAERGAGAGADLRERVGAAGHLALDDEHVFVGRVVLEHQPGGAAGAGGAAQVARGRVRRHVRRQGGDVERGRRALPVEVAGGHAVVVRRVGRKAGVGEAGCVDRHV